MSSIGVTMEEVTQEVVTEITVDFETTEMELEHPVIGVEVGMIGPQGVQGEKGDKGDKGEQGIQGSPGYGIDLLGSVATADDLPPVSEHNPGEGFIAEDTGSLWVVAENNQTWVHAGHIQGPQGIQGPPGPMPELPPESDPNLSTDYGTTVTAGAAYQTAVGAQIGGMGGTYPGATAFGARSAVLGQFGIAMGYSAYAGGHRAIAIGQNAVAGSNEAIAIGANSTAPPGGVALGSQFQISSDGKVTAGGKALNPWVQMTQAEYTALPVKDPNTLYVIVG